MENRDAGFADLYYPAPFTNDYQGKFSDVSGTDFSSLSQADTIKDINDAGLTLEDVHENFPSGIESLPFHPLFSSTQTEELGSHLQDLDWQISESDRRAELSNTDCGHLLQSDPESNSTRHGKSLLSSSSEQHFFDGSLTENGLKKTDSFCRLRSEEFGDITAYLETIENENEVEDSNISPFGNELDIEQLLLEAQNRWLSPAEIYEILKNYKKLRIAPEPPNLPGSGSLFLLDRKVHKYFRNDGHNWKKKKNGTKVLEGHERLKVGSIEVLHCYYGHGEENRSFHRRSYWMIEEEPSHIALVHYLEVQGNKTNYNCIKATEETPYSQEIAELIPSSGIEDSMSSSFHSNNFLLPPQTIDTTTLASAQASECEDAKSVYNKQASSRFDSSLYLQHPVMENIDAGFADPYYPAPFTNDSFYSWMSKELGDIEESHMQSSSGAYRETIENENEVEDSNISPSVSQDQLYSIIGFSPNWAYVGSEIEVLIIGKFLMSRQEAENNNWSCMFGEVEVPAEILAGGVLRCHTPAQKAGRVPFYVTCSNRLACSELREFEYRENNVRLGDITRNLSISVFPRKSLPMLVEEDDDWDVMSELSSKEEFSVDTAIGHKGIASCLAESDVSDLSSHLSSITINKKDDNASEPSGESPVQTVSHWSAAAIRIQNKFRSWKGRKDFLTIRQQIVKIQAHVRGHQVRKNYKKIIWSVGITENSSMIDTSLKEDDDEDFLKEGRKQKEERLQKALARVESTTQHPEARDQYSRLLNVVNEIQETKTASLHNSGVSADFYDDLIDTEAL